jgi:hypothetical protein
MIGLDTNDRLRRQFVLIGGTAATLAMVHSGLKFRATKEYSRAGRNSTS